MKFHELGIQEFLQHGSQGEGLRFAGDRVLLLNADALGDLRQHLLENHGNDAARAALTHFGFSQGWRMANTIYDQFEWPTTNHWREAGTHLGRLAGIFGSNEEIHLALADGGMQLGNSFEAQQHVSRFGNAEKAVCWNITGFLSGYLSRTENADILVLEEACIACGSDKCRFVARTRSDWKGESKKALPEDSPGRIEALLAQVSEVPNPVEERSLRKSSSSPRHNVEIPSSGIVTDSPEMRQAVTLAEKVAGVNLTVLISGESGSGKERIARYIHERSTRADRPFVAINCGAINENLLESELFGHTKGSFTGAVQARAGIFEAAHRGTLLLDEIGEISLAMQVKLLRVLQEHEVQRVGESETRPVDVRLLAATNCDLHLQTELGTFREDLFYRIHVVEVIVPPLRHRREDILPLARTLLTQSAERLKRHIIGFSPAVADQLLRHAWPGNVRELENAMERAVALAPGSRIEMSDLPPSVLAAPGQHHNKLDSVRPLQDISKDYILAALDLNDGNQTHTAKQLGIGTATLYRKLKSYGYRVADPNLSDSDLISALLDPN